MKTLPWQRSVRLTGKMAPKFENEWRFQGVKRRFRKPKHRKESIKKDSKRYFLE